MKHLFHLLPRLAAVAAVALSFSSCNRAEYAMLPKTTPYHATYGTIKPAPTPAAANKEAIVTEATIAKAPEKSLVATAPIAAPAPAAATTAKTPVAASVVTKAPAVAPRKLTLVQKLGVAKVLKQVDKATSKAQFKKHSETAAASKLTGKLRQGIILILIGLGIELLAALVGSSIIYLLGAILILIGVVLIVLYLLDEV